MSPIAIIVIWPDPVSTGGWATLKNKALWHTSYPERSKRLYSSQHQTVMRNVCGDHSSNVTTWCMQFLKGYHVYKVIWPKVRLKVQKCHTKVTIKFGSFFDVENISSCIVTTWYRHIYDHVFKGLQHIAIWWWPSSKVQKGQTKVNIKRVCNFDVDNILVNLKHNACNFWVVIVFASQLDLDLVWKFEKVIQRSMVNTSKILMRRRAV